MTDLRTIYYTDPRHIFRAYYRATMPTTIPVTSISTDTLTLTTAADATAFAPGDVGAVASTQVPLGEVIQVQDVGAGTIELVSNPTGHTSGITYRKLSPWMSYRSSSAVSGYSATTLSSEQMVGYIEEAEATFEEKTRHSWRAKSTSEVIDWPHGIPVGRSWLDGVPVQLRHRNVRAFSTSLDKIEVHDGNADYTDMTTGGTWTEGHVGGQFWFEYESGQLYIKHFFKRYTAGAIRVTYRYGDSSVPGSVRRACTLDVCMRLAESEWGLNTVPEGMGDSGLGSDPRVSSWRKEYEAIVKVMREMPIAGR